MYSQETARLIASQATYRDLRRELCPSTILWAWGKREPIEKAGTRLRYVNPFRDDHRPSLDVWRSNSNGEWRVGDFAEDWEGSPIDLEIRFSGEDTQAAAKACRDHYAWQLQNGTRFNVATPNGGGFKWKPGEHNKEAAARWHAALQREKPCLPPPQWLRQHFDISISEREVVWAPSYGYGDEATKVVAYKMLSREGKKTGFKSKIVRYRSDNSERMALSGAPLLLAEGESDTWVLTHLFGHRYAVIGFPGASQDADKILDGLDLDGREVCLAFDGDSSGIESRAKLAGWLHDQGAVVTIVPMFEGKDAAELDEYDITRLVEDWQQPWLPPLDIGVAANSYFRITRGGNQGAAVSDFMLEVERLYISDDPQIYAYGGKIKPNNKPFVILSTQIETAPMKVWCRSHRVSWTGNASDLERLAAHLRYQATLVPVARMTTRVGLHRGAFIWPERTIGPGEWTYIPPDIGMDLKQQLGLPAKLPAPESVAQVMDNLFGLHDEYVTTTMLSWLAAAPLRPLFDKFPILHVTGLSGSGKTTLTQILLWAFSGTMRLGYTLTSTTPYGIAMLFESVNNVPIWFDEYRPGARTDAKMFLDQTMRDAYTGQISIRGDVATKGSKLQQFRTDAPIIVTGEDTLTERSHLDRSIVLHLSKKKQNPAALAFFDFVVPIANSYMDWLIRAGHTKEPIRTEVLELKSDNADVINERQKRNLWVLRYGHGLIAEWLADIGAFVEVPDLDWTALAADAATTAQQDSIIELILWAIDTRRYDAAFATHDHVYVHPTELLRLATSPSGPPIQLPYSNPVAMRSQLVDQYGAKNRNVTAPAGDREVRMMQIDADFILPVN